MHRICVILAGLLTLTSPGMAFAEWPIGAEAARARGIELPLPFGLSWTHMEQDQPFKVTRLEVSAGGAPVPASIEKLTNEDRTDTLRLDAWVFPFLNIYLLAGRSDSESEGTATIPAGLFGPSSLMVPFKQRYKGDILGLGLTLAAGYRSFFATLDANYTETNIDISEDDAKAIVINPRLGWNGRYHGWQGALWVGAMYQDLQQTLVIETEFMGAPVTAIIEEQAAEPWNTVVGASWNINRRVQLLLEGGFGQRQQWLASLGYRF